jgi:cyclophilin family peptidyl-prolyl cis-trans isomerase
MRTMIFATILLLSAAPVRAERSPDGDAPPAAENPPRVAVHTSEGCFALELYPELAPANVRLFLAAAGLADPPSGGTAGEWRDSIVCESRAHGFLVFGCVPPARPAGKPRPVERSAPTPDEIDAAAMGLAADAILDPREVEGLWQREMVPRWRTLEARGEPIPPRLDRLVRDLRRRGMVATGQLAGQSRLWYLETLGYRFRAGASPLRVERGAVATAARWPGEADARFLVALSDIPERSGRATVFGQVVEGWSTLERIAAQPVTKSHVPREPIAIERVERGGCDDDASSS